ncbi:MAG TPA: hypothetical protein VGP93_14720, partial [Polyangiaceae bacterium]|nr:hypothetical protein [Polyangiaceae bacterium]
MVSSEIASATELAVEATESRGFVEWLWRRRAVSAARARLHLQSELEQRRLKHASAAAELAERVPAPVDPLRVGPERWLSLLLYRHAAYWALL